MLGLIFNRWESKQINKFALNPLVNFWANIIIAFINYLEWFYRIYFNKCIQRIFNRKNQWFFNPRESFYRIFHIQFKNVAFWISIKSLRYNNKQCAKSESLRYNSSWWNHIKTFFNLSNQLDRTLTIKNVCI